MTPDELLADEFAKLSEEEQAEAILHMTEEVVSDDIHKREAERLDAAVLAHGEKILDALSKKSA